MFLCRNPNVYNVGGHGDGGTPGVQGILQGRDQAEDDGREEEAAEEVVQVVQEAAKRMRAQTRFHDIQRYTTIYNDRNHCSSYRSSSHEPRHEAPMHLAEYC